LCLLRNVRTCCSTYLLDCYPIFWHSVALGVGALILDGNLIFQNTLAGVFLGVFVIVHFFNKALLTIP